MTAPTRRTTEFIRDLVGFDTVSRNSNLALIEFVRDYLSGLGVDSRLIHDETGKKANLYATLGPQEGSGLMLSGHTDVVPVDGQDWSTDPFTLTERDGKLFGRGACDMKSFIAVVLALVPDILERDLQRPVHLAFTYDEEVGCFGARRLIEQLEHMPQRPACCVVGEPTGMAVVNGHKGKMSVRCHVRGLEGHSAHTDRAVNAVEAAAELVAFLKAMARRLKNEGPHDGDFDPPYTTVHTGVMGGGTALTSCRGNVPSSSRFAICRNRTPAIWYSNSRTSPKIRYCRRCGRYPPNRGLPGRNFAASRLLRRTTIPTSSGTRCP